MGRGGPAQGAQAPGLTSNKCGARNQWALGHIGLDTPGRRQGAVPFSRDQVDHRLPVLDKVPQKGWNPVHRLIR